jgi:hypothetical protein
MFFDKPLKMMAAVTRIQWAFQLYSWKKKQQKTPLTRIMERRGAVWMQRGWRKWVLQHRLHSLINIKKVWDKIIEPTFYIETTVYNHMNTIIDNEVNRWRFEEQYLNFEVDENGKVNAQVFLPKTTRYDEESTIPQWFGFEIPVKHFDDVVEWDPYSLIHQHKYGWIWGIECMLNIEEHSSKFLHNSHNWK